MEKDIHEEMELLGEELKSRECVRKLKELEKQMEENKEVLLLSSDFMKAQRDYSDALKHYEEGSPELKKYLARMHETKFALDCHPLVGEYYQVLSEVNEPLRYLEMNLLSLFRGSGHSCF